MKKSKLKFNSKLTLDDSENLDLYLEIISINNNVTNIGDRVEISVLNKGDLIEFSLEGDDYSSSEIRLDKNQVGYLIDYLKRTYDLME